MSDLRPIPDVGGASKSAFGLMQAELRYPSLVRAGLPRELSDAVTLTARARFMTTSEYLRQALLKSLKDDGAVLSQRSMGGGVE
jgi:hypothetical protein